MTPRKPTSRSTLFKASRLANDVHAARTPATAARRVVRRVVGRKLLRKVWRLL